VFAAPAPACASSPAGELEPFTEAIPGSQVSFDMVAIPGGEFLLGSPGREPGGSAIASATVGAPPLLRVGRNCR
jgi:hypothetical protein